MSGALSDEARAALEPLHAARERGERQAREWLAQWRGSLDMPWRLRVEQLLRRARETRDPIAACESMAQADAIRAVGMRKDEALDAMGALAPRAVEDLDR